MTYEVNTFSDDCIASIKSNSLRLFFVLGYGRDRKVILEAPLYDKDCVLGNNLAAHYLFSSDISRAKTYARAAEYHLGKATPYEKAFFEAVNYLISDNMDEDVALELHSKILPENQEHDYVYGMLAFSLLERGHLAEAEKAARKGYEINKNDSWAHHCLCHVLQTECRFKEAVEFMEACSASWDSCSSLRTCNMNNKKQQLMQKAIQLAEAVYEYGKGNNTKALEMLGPNFDVIYHCVLNTGFAAEKSYLMEGNAEAVVTTCEKANVLESSYFKFS
ncbi:unnamed protein product [Brassica oleracea var. botrytis]